MLFQTLVQLNILILATPALAGWSLLPPVHGVTGCVAGIVWHTALPKCLRRKLLSVTRGRLLARLLWLVCPCLRLSRRLPACLRPAPIFASFPIPPHAARAP